MAEHLSVDFPARGVRRSRRLLHPRVPPPTSSPVPPYPGDVVELQNETVGTVEEQSVVVGAQGNPIRVVYGRQVIGPDIAAVLKNGADLVLLCVWCEGECDAVERYWINGADPVSGMVANHYLGATGQGIDPLVKNACIASGLPAYTDTLPGICYSVFQIPPGTCSGFPQATVLIRGRKVSTSSGGAKTYSTNPAYCIADFIENASFGLGRTVDWDSVATVATHCDEMIGSPAEHRNQFSLVLSEQQPAENWLAIMRDYAGCWVVPEGAGYRLVLDATGTLGATKSIDLITETDPMRVETSAAHGFADGAILKISGINGGMIEANGVFAVASVFDSTHVDLLGIDATGFSGYTSGGSITQIGVSAYSFNASNIVAGTFNAQYRSQMESPTVVEVDYTDTTAIPWRTATIDPVYVPGVYDIVPAVPFRRTRVSRPGTTRYSEAHRYAVQLLNGGQLNDLAVQFQARDVAITLQVGDLIDVTHPCGLSSKIFRLVRAEAVSPGRWNIVATEHDDAKYSDAVVIGPTTLDGPLDSPLSPPTVTGLSVSEINPVDGSGAYVSKLSITWTDVSPGYPFVLQYRVDVFDGETLVETGTTQRSLDATHPPVYVTAAVPENRLYRVRVYTVSTLSAISAAAEATRLTDGKTALPSDVPSITASEIGGTVFINWAPATDVDLTGYWLKWGATGGSWATAATLDRINAIHYETKSLPAGTWRIWIKALDSVRSPAYPWGQESANATYCDVTVTLDTSAFIVTESTFSSPSLTNMVAVPEGWVTCMNETWDDLFNDVMGTFDQPLWSIHGSGAGELLSETADAGAVIAGAWVATVNRTNIDGASPSTSTAQLELSSNGTDWDTYTGLTATAEARYSRLRVSTTGFNTVLVGNPIGTVKCTAITRSESGTFVSSNTAGVAVSFAVSFAKLQSIRVEVSGLLYRGAYDNVTGDGFDGSVLDGSGNRVNGITANWTAIGV